MNTYKITNITNFLGKRDVKFNVTVDIEYVDNMNKKILSVKPGDTAYLTIGTLPLSVHKLRIKKMITIVEVTPFELNKTMNVTKVVNKTAPVGELEKNKVEHKNTNSSKKRVGRKDDESDIQKDE